VAGIICSPAAPITFIRTKISDRWGGATITILIYLCSISAFTAYKHVLDIKLSFFADGWLASIDEYLFIGQPWYRLRAITPRWLDWPLYSLYSQIWFIYLIGGFLVAAFVQNSKTRNVYMATLIAQAFVLDMIIRSALNSAGPVFYDRVFGGDRFSGLIEALRNSPAGPATLRIVDYLWYSYATDRTVLGTGISAMPSGHLAIVTINALLASAMSRAAGYVAWVYVAIIMYGSIYFGWHYSLDGVVSIVTVIALWRCCDRLIDNAMT